MKSAFYWRKFNFVVVLFKSYIWIEIFYSLFLSLRSSSFSEIGDLGLKKPDKREEGNDRTHKKANKGKDLSSFEVELFEFLAEQYDGAPST